MVSQSCLVFLHFAFWVLSIICLCAAWKWPVWDPQIQARELSQLSCFGIIYRNTEMPFSDHKHTTSNAQYNSFSCRKSFWNSKKNPKCWNLYFPNASKWNSHKGVFHLALAPLGAFLSKACIHAANKGFFSKCPVAVCYNDVLYILIWASVLDKHSIQWKLNMKILLHGDMTCTVLSNDTLHAGYRHGKLQYARSYRQHVI